MTFIKSVRLVGRASEEVALAIFKVLLVAEVASFMFSQLQKLLG